MGVLWFTGTDLEASHLITAAVQVNPVHSAAGADCVWSTLGGSGATVLHQEDRRDRDLLSKRRFLFFFLTLILYS